MKLKSNKTIKSLKLKKIKKSLITLVAIIVLTMVSQFSIAQTGEFNAELTQDPEYVLASKHLAISTSKLKPLTFGLQFSAQKYSEVIFFQNEKTNL